MYMDGVTARSLRAKGCPYKLIWGVSQEHLRDIAREHVASHATAIGLWKRDVRESKLLATLLMPAEEMTIDEARAWVADVLTTELAEMLVFNLLQNCSFADILARDCLTAPRDIEQLVGLHLFARLFLKGYTPEGTDADAFLEGALKALTTDNPSVVKVAMNGLQRFAALGAPYDETVTAATRTAGYDFL